MVPIACAAAAVGLAAIQQPQRGGETTVNCIAAAAV